MRKQYWELYDKDTGEKLDEAWIPVTKDNHRLDALLWFGINRHWLRRYRDKENNLEVRRVCGMGELVGVDLDERRLGTVMASLRYWQSLAYGGTHTLEECLDMASNHGEVAPLTTEEINELCEHMNTGGA